MANKFKYNGKYIAIGNQVAVHQKIVENDRIRAQVFKGLVIAVKGRGVGKTFVVRRIGANAVGIERIWPVNSPWIEKIETEFAGKPARSKLYYLRDRIGKAALKVKLKKKVSDTKKKTPKASAKKAVSKKKSPKASPKK